jgi:hypothetical protein
MIVRGLGILSRDEWALNSHTTISESKQEQCYRFFINDPRQWASLISHAL